VLVIKPSPKHIAQHPGVAAIVFVDSHSFVQASPGRSALELKGFLDSGVSQLKK
jgi:hypothetical protein